MKNVKNDIKDQINSMPKNNVKMYVICNKKHQLTDTEYLIKLSLYGFIYLFFVLLFQYFQTTLQQTQWHLYSHRVFGENVNMWANFPPCCPFLWDRCFAFFKNSQTIYAGYVNVATGKSQTGRIKLNISACKCCGG